MTGGPIIVPFYNGSFMCPLTN